MMHAHFYTNLDFWLNMIYFLSWTLLSKCVALFHFTKNQIKNVQLDVNGDNVEKDNRIFVNKKHFGGSISDYNWSPLHNWQCVMLTCQIKVA